METRRTNKPSLKDIQQLVQLPIELGPVTVNVMADPECVTFETFEAMRSLNKKPAEDPEDSNKLGQAADNLNSVITLFLEVVKEWDLTEVDGETVVPLTEERLKKLDIKRVLMPIFNKVYEGLNPTIEEAPSSAAS